MTNSTIETLLSHRSIRKFTAEPIPRADLETILACGRAASSSTFIQCVSIVRVTDTTKRTKLAEYAGNQPYVAECAEFLVFCADFHRHQQLVPDAKLGFTEQTLIGAVDTALVAQNCLTAAESMGLGGVYIGGLRNSPEQVSELLALPEHVLPLFGLCLGYPAQNPEQKPRLPLALMLHEEQYQELDQKLLSNYDEHVAAYYRARTNGQVTHSWSEQIQKTLTKEARPFMKAFLAAKGFSTR
ncbi:oxygen-insensitive NADPH nitroreductase [Thaumasiovibrio subtropicus]|uniref:oxygen-insensitive NADPH nitroreductase n=1 Tax=Thaumasiovibrio subtropicus TaxID=1891207 RepID=UPI000B352B8C|nr:oxygen-insensitive NADPH nitroreductase [Thaumasiovibrio subtropicus]